MPIIDADKAKTVLAIKRSKNPGFAGIDNELYVQDNTWMLFGDAKAVLSDLVKQFGSGGLQDRKSTRLNSSHANISYAVFCLKKKKHTRFWELAESMRVGESLLERALHMTHAA